MSSQIQTPSSPPMPMAATKSGGGGGGNLWIYLIGGSIILFLIVGLIITIYLAIKFRPKNVYLPAYPLPKSEVYIVMFDEGGVSILKKSDGTIDKTNKGADGNPRRYNVTFTSGSSTIASESSTINFNDYAEAAVGAIKRQAFKYAFGGNQGAEKVALASPQQVVEALKAGANWNVPNAETVYRIMNATGGTGSPLSESSAYNPDLSKDDGWNKIIYTTEGFYKFEGTEAVEKATPEMLSSSKVFAVAFFGPKQPPSDYNSRQYDFTEKYNSTRSSNNEGLLNPPFNAARPTITFPAKSTDLGTNFSNGSFNFRFRKLPFNKDKWSQTYGNDFRTATLA